MGVVPSFDTMPRKGKLITVSLPPDVADELRRYAEAEHEGNVSAAVAELVRQRRAAVTK